MDGMNSMERASSIRSRQRGEWAAVVPGWISNREKMSVQMTVITQRMLSAARLRPGDRVLDLACGVGDPAIPIAETVGPEGFVLGLDLSPEMVGAARRIAERQGLSNIEFRQIDSELDPGVPPESCDAATCRLGLMFMPGPVAALRTMHDALKPGGRVVVTTWGRPERNPNFSLPLELIARHASVPAEEPDSPGFFAIPTPQKLAPMLEEAGFSSVEASAFEITGSNAKNAENYWYGVSNMAGPLVSLIRTLNDAQRRAVREDLQQAIREQFGGGPVEFEGEAIIATGVKRMD